VSVRTAEARDANGMLFTSTRKFVLAGVSRRVMLNSGLPDAAKANENLLPTTSLCIAGARRITGAPVGDGRAPVRFEPRKWTVRASD
jgi:hypothetical protein